MTLCVAAVATAPGISPRAVIRLSGPGAIGIARGLFVPAAHEASGALPAWRWIEGRARWAEGPGGTVPAGLVLFRAPRSYTGEEGAELHVPGSPVVVRGVLASLHAAGARAAGPGEFTRRAFENGRLTLAQAEAVLAVIDAERESDHRRALAELRAGRRAEVARLRDRVCELLARIEGSLDFSEEGIDFFGEGTLAARLGGLAAEAAGLAGTGGAEPSRALPRILLVGKANAGKSTLFNALLDAGAVGTIESPVAGTTRDVVEARAVWDGVEIVLADTPGQLPPCPLTGEGRDVGERDADAAGQAVLQEALARKPFVLFVVDGSRPWEAEDAAVEAATRACPRRIVLAKADLPRASDPPPPPGGEGRGEGEPLAVSARTGRGVPELRSFLAAWAAGEGRFDPAAASAAERAGLEEAAARLAAARAEAERGGALELVALSVREATEAFAPLFGDYPSDDILDRVFSRFCIGK